MRPPHTRPPSPPMLPPPPPTPLLRPPPPLQLTLPPRPRCTRPPPPLPPRCTLPQSRPMRPQLPPPHMVSLRALHPTSRDHSSVNLMFIYLFICTIHNPCLHGISKCRKDYVQYL